jgi:hypothetical protein
MVLFLCDLATIRHAEVLGSYRRVVGHIKLVGKTYQKMVNSIYVNPELSACEYDSTATREGWRFQACSEFVTPILFDMDHAECNLF